MVRAIKWVDEVRLCKVSVMLYVVLQCLVIKATVNQFLVSGHCNACNNYSTSSFERLFLFA